MGNKFLRHIASRTTSDAVAFRAFDFEADACAELGDPEHRQADDAADQNILCMMAAPSVSRQTGGRGPGVHEVEASIILQDAVGMCAIGAADKGREKAAGTEGVELVRAYPIARNSRPTLKS